MSDATWRAKPLGWATGEILTSPQMDTIDEQQSIALDYVYSGGLRNWTAADSGLTFAVDATNQLDSGIWIVVGSTDTAERSFDDLLSAESFSSGMGSTVALECVAGNGNVTAIAAGNSATVYLRADLYSGSWSTVTAPGTPTLIVKAAYNTDSGQFVIAGECAGPTPYIATSTDSTGSVFTNRSSGLPASFAAKRIGCIALNGDTIIAAAAVSTPHTKIAYSSDAGVTWSDSTTSLTSGGYAVVYSNYHAKFFAVRIDDGTTNSVYSSTDGNTWTTVSASSLGFPTYVGASNPQHSIAVFGRALVVPGIIDSSGGSGIAFSLDGGLTWELFRTAKAQPACFASDVNQGRILSSSGTATPSRSMRIASGS